MCRAIHVALAEQNLKEYEEKQRGSKGQKEIISSTFHDYASHNTSLPYNA